MAGIFLFYGLISSVWLYSINYDLQQREIIGFNGPIVFGQYMIISFTIYLLYGNKLKGYTAFLLSFLSLSKGPFIAGLLTIYLNYRSKSKFLIYMLLLAASVLIFAPNIRVLEWLTHLNSVEDLLKLSSISARVDAYTQSYYLISESLMGLGWGGWKEVSYLKYPHNIFLEILVELPLILAVFFIFYIGFVFYSIKDKRYRILFSIMLLMALFSGSIIDNRGIFFITMLFLLAGKSKNDPC
jgi:O-antigen ligase